MNKPRLNITKVDCVAGHYHATVHSDSGHGGGGREVEQKLTLSLAKKIDSSERKRDLACGHGLTHRYTYERGFRLGSRKTTDKFFSLESLFNCLGKKPSDYEIVCDWQITEELKKTKL